MMAKDHALIEEGETRAFYIVFDDHNDMLRVIDFVFTYYKKKNCTVARLTFAMTRMMTLVVLAMTLPLTDTNRTGIIPHKT